MNFRRAQRPRGVKVFRLGKFDLMTGFEKGKEIA
jgi:hypothetical protein